jgi:hypothetical protein
VSSSCSPTRKPDPIIQIVIIKIKIIIIIIIIVVIIIIIIVVSKPLFKTLGTSSHHLDSPSELLGPLPWPAVRCNWFVEWRRACFAFCLSDVGFRIRAHGSRFRVQV